MKKEQFFKELEKRGWKKKSGCYSKGQETIYLDIDDKRRFFVSSHINYFSNKDMGRYFASNYFYFVAVKLVDGKLIGKLANTLDREIYHEF